MIGLFRLMKKGVSALLSLALITLLLVPQAARAVDANPSTKLDTMISDTVSFYEQNRPELNSWWQMVALWGAGEDLHNSKWTLPSWEQSDPGDLLETDSSTYHINLIFGLLAMNLILPMHGKRIVICTQS